MDVEKIFAVEAEKRMKAGVKVEDDPESMLTQGKAAAAVNTNKQYVLAAKKLEKDAPDLLEKVRSGEMI